MLDRLLLLALVFTPLSLVSIGGGSAILADIEQQTVHVHHWLTEAQFLDAFAISRAAPGPNFLIVTVIGWHVAGIWGALVTTAAIVVPSSLLVYGLAQLWRRYRDAPWQAKLERGLAPVAAGLVLAGCFAVLKIAEGGILAWAVAGLVALALMKTKINPLALLGGGGAVFGVASLFS